MQVKHLLLYAFLTTLPLCAQPETEEKEVADQVSSENSKYDSLIAEADSIKAEIEELKTAKGKLKGQKKVLRSKKREAIKNDPRQYTEIYKNNITYAFRMTSVGPYDDDEPHILMTQGIGYVRHINKLIGLGVKDLSFDSFETIRGNRYTFTTAPEIELSLYPIKPIQLGTEIGAAIQGQFSKNESNSISLVPFISLFSQFYVVPRFSVGPEVQFNVAAYGDHHLSTYENSSVIPEGGAWFDAGIKLAFHF
jgi:hypothetical protein